ncbi:BglG family transcription antiterminator [Virgibacillus siamensis]|uniref:BglG family transcription antiterminator n=1 Tax=Virgibacillus siamensis TaxID=480071 RepID=UPI000985215A|nr:BglG family transcription antiterminator [Virgibacillus siamensis]
MQLDERSSQLFGDLVDNPGIKGKELECRYNISRRQLGYSITKINDWLQFHNLPEIERTKQGYFLIKPEIVAKFSNANSAMDTRILSEDERVYMILLMILSNHDLSLIHFTSELAVSKNTILSDLKQAQNIAETYDLNIRYSRREGYQMDGNEFHIRKLLMKVIYKIVELHQGKQRIRQAAGITENEVEALAGRIEKVENKLNLKFTDEKLDVMPYLFVIILRRISNGLVIAPFSIQYNELADTKEYAATEELFSGFQDIPEEERLFITLHLLTSNVHWSEFLTKDSIPNLLDALKNMIDLFEQTACMKLQDKEQLLQKLMLHVKPAYYRIKYHLTEVNDIKAEVSREFKALHHIVKKSTGPLEKLIGSTIPENETTYLTMLIGGWLTRQGDSIQEKVKAVVVCPQGVSVSRLLYSELRDLFPEFIFLDSLSVREFQRYQLDYDIVFSPVAMETTKRQYTVNSFLEREEKNTLRKQVMQELHGFTPSTISTDDLIAIIKKHTDIQNEKELQTELETYLNRDELPDLNPIQEQAHSPTLAELIPPDRIVLKDSVSSWEEAIRTGAEPMLRTGRIEEDYVEAMVNDYNKESYIVIAPNVAIPHAAPEDGVNEVSMSLLRLKHGVTFAKDYSINLIFVIAAVDKQQHLQALMQLMKLVHDDNDRHALMEADSKEAVHNLLKSYSKTT